LRAQLSLHDFGKSAAKPLSDFAPNGRRLPRVRMRGRPTAEGENTMGEQEGRIPEDTIGADYERVISTYYGEDPVTAIINLKVDTKEVDRLATQVSDFACVEDVFLVTGETDIVVKAMFRDYRMLKDFVVNDLANLEGIKDTVTLMVVTTYKERGKMKEGPK
jgi:DNA-binding Lrp family transcriptional regulator